MAAAPAPKLPLPTSQLSQGYNKYRLRFYVGFKAQRELLRVCPSLIKYPYSRRQERNPTTNSQQIRTNSSV
ncbi:hypothetical protein FOPG_01685 [Fusarium oxysporum f. sp. conglutinans race 2 54008]|uniref:Uncharacterized protein n=1 Tax=Fusarium oxysporum f. sp. conglutinans race 2 54008 TaxID=1089457 RepID=X0ITN1_FUSOX|nr:hypothetical protein FOPG_01685 [Fusarium oxysporum f. sp. conglutinans race 2 54008]